MNKKKVLIITYYFPPLGGAGISRPLALFQNLPAYNYDCHILTVKPVLYRAYEPEMLQELDSSKIFRSGSRDPARLLYILGIRHVSAKSADHSRMVSEKFFPDSKAGWIKPAIRMGKKLVKANDYDLILSTSPPISAHVIAKRLSVEFGISWVADFRDYWTSKKAEVYFDSDAKRQNARQLLDSIKSSAKVIVAVNESVAKDVGAESVITNCYDSQLVKQWKRPKLKDKFTIGVFGTISELTPIHPLLDVLQSVKRNRPELYSRIRVLQVGQADFHSLNQLVKEMSLREIFDFKGFQPRAKAIELLSEAALFYAGVSPKLGFGLTTHRIFTLLSSGRPILGYTESGSEFEHIMSQSANSFLFNDSKVEEAGRFLSQKAEQYLKGDLSIDIEPAAVREFSSENMAGRFAKILDQILNDIK